MLYEYLALVLCLRWLAVFLPGILKSRENNASSLLNKLILAYVLRLSGISSVQQNRLLWTRWFMLVTMYYRWHGRDKSQKQTRFQFFGFLLY